MEKQGSSSLFHGLDHHTEFGSHRRVGLLQGIEIKDDIQDFTGDLGAGADQRSMTNIEGQGGRR